MNDSFGLARRVLRALRGGFRDYAAYSLFIGALGLVMFLPLLGWIAQRLIDRTGGAAIANTDIVQFFLSPLGIVSALVVGTVAIFIVLFNVAGIIAMDVGDETGQRPRLRATLGLLWDHLGRLLVLGALFALALVAVALPIMLLAGQVYEGLLSEYDINYYLSDRPPAFWAAVGIAVVVFSIVGLLLFYVYTRWLYSIPRVFFRGDTPIEALRASWAQTRGRFWRLALALIGWGVGMAIFWLVITSAYHFVAGVLIRSVVDAPSNAAIFVLASVLVLGGVVSWFVAYFFAATRGILISQLYLRTCAEDGEPALTVEGLPFTAEDAAREIDPLRLGLATVALLGLAAVALFGALRLVDTTRLDHETTKITAHRGGALEAPENTVAALENAIEAGADYVEFDVQRSADGIVVVNHDQDLMRIAGSPDAIASTSLADLDTVDIGSYFDPRFSDQRVATLEDFLKTAKGKVRLNIELKYYGHDPELVPQVLQEIRAQDMEDDVVMMSLSETGIQQVQELAPDMTVGLLSGASIGNLTDVDVDFLAISAGGISRDLVKQAHASGKTVEAWTINDELQMLDMIDMGVDSLITDVPTTAKSVIQRRAELTPSQLLLLRFSKLWLEDPPEVEQ